MDLTTVINAAAGLNGVRYITAGQTATPPTGRSIIALIALGGDATLSGLEAPAESNLPNNLVLTQDVPYPISCASVTLDAGTVGNLLALLA